MPSEKLTTTESAEAKVNAVPPKMLEVEVTVTSASGLTLGHLDEPLEKGDTVKLHQDVAQLLMSQGVVEQA